MFLIFVASMGFLGGSVVKKLPANARDSGDVGLIPGLGRSLAKERMTHSSILDWKSHGQRSLVGLQTMGLQRVGHDRRSIHGCMDYISVGWHWSREFTLLYPEPQNLTISTKNAFLLSFQIGEIYRVNLGKCLTSSREFIFISFISLSKLFFHNIMRQK